MDTTMNPPILYGPSFDPRYVLLALEPTDKFIVRRPDTRPAWLYRS